MAGERDRDRSAETRPAPNAEGEPASSPSAPIPAPDVRAPGIRKAPPMTQEQQDAARGIDLARRAMMARAEGDEVEVLAIINEARTTGEAAYASAMLLSCLWDATVQFARGNELKAAGALRRSADKLNEYAVLTQVEMIVRDAEAGGSHG